MPERATIRIIYKDDEEMVGYATELKKAGLVSFDEKDLCKNSVTEIRPTRLLVSIIDNNK